MFSVCCFLLSALCGCGKGSQDLPTVAPDSIPTTVTWTAHIQPLMQFYCTACHFSSQKSRPGADCEEESMNLNDYDSVVNCIPNILEAVEKAQNMPPGGARRMTSLHKALLRAWLNGGLAK